MTEAEVECGCRIQGDIGIDPVLLKLSKNTLHTVYCPLHKAAPDLLEACIEVEHNLRQGAMCKDDLVSLRAAINKATGGKQ